MTYVHSDTCAHVCACVHTWACMEGRGGHQLPCAITVSFTATCAGEPQGPGILLCSPRTAWLWSGCRDPNTDPHVYTTSTLTYWTTSLAPKPVISAHYSLVFASGVEHATRNKVNASTLNEQRTEYMSCNICRRLDPGPLLITKTLGMSMSPIHSGIMFAYKRCPSSL